MAIKFVNGQKDMVKKEFSDIAPEWRKVHPGLILLGICENKQCVAKGKEVICPIEIGIFDFIKEKNKVKCPLCENIFIPYICGFYFCQYKIFGKIYKECILKDFVKEGKASKDHFEVWK